jgi:pre-mRNA-splicing factor CWC22
MSRRGKSKSLSSEETSPPKILESKDSDVEEKDKLDGGEQEHGGDARKNEDGNSSDSSHSSRSSSDSSGSSSESGSESDSDHEKEKGRKKLKAEPEFVKSAAGHGDRNVDDTDGDDRRGSGSVVEKDRKESPAEDEGMIASNEGRSTSASANATSSTSTSTSMSKKAALSLASGPTGGRTGGVYVPPFKLAQMRKQMELQGKDDPASAENQKLSWEALRKSINGLINKVNALSVKPTSHLLHNIIILLLLFYFQLPIELISWIFYESSSLSHVDA